MNKKNHQLLSLHYYQELVSHRQTYKIPIPSFFSFGNSLATLPTPLQQTKQNLKRDPFEEGGLLHLATKQYQAHSTYHLRYIICIIILSKISFSLNLPRIFQKETEISGEFSKRFLLHCFP